MTEDQIGDIILQVVNKARAEIALDWMKRDGLLGGDYCRIHDMATTYAVADMIEAAHGFRPRLKLIEHVLRIEVWSRSR